MLKYFAFFLAGLVPAFGRAQTITEKLQAFNEQRPQEKVFIHLNKKVFSPKEDIWMKAYHFDARNHEQPGLSGVLYVDLVNAKGTLIDQRTLELADGSAIGDFSLPDTLSPGNYEIRGYTNYMLNFDNQLIHSQAIKVVSYGDKTSDFVSQGIFDVQFFPEGGEFVAGLVNNIGFKATGPDGLGVTLSGVVFDNTGQEIQRFETGFAGMGSFRIIPEIGKTYIAQVIHQGFKLEYPLPQVQATGAVIQLTNKKDQISIRVLTKEYNLEGHVLIGYQNGKVVLLLNPDPTNSYMYASYDFSNFPPGVIYLTLFDHQQRPIAERLSFINTSVQNARLDIDIEEKFKKRSPVESDINLDFFDQTGAADLSVSVFDFTLNSTGSGNIKTYLLLESDLSGHIERPNTYFEMERNRADQALDDLMLTQGWRRFTWKDVLSDTLPPVDYYLEQELKIRGQLLKYYDRDKPLKGEVSLTVLEDPLIEAQVITDVDGQFEFSGLNFADTITAIFQAKKPGRKTKKNPHRERNDAYFIQLTERSHPMSGINWADLSSDEWDNITQRVASLDRQYREFEAAFSDEVIVLEAMEVATTQSPFNDGVESQALMYNNPTRRYELDSMEFDPRENAATMSDVIRSLQIPGFNAGTLQSRGANSFTGSSAVVFFYNGFPVDQEFVFQDLSPNDVGTIDYFTGNQAAIFGAQGASGVIVIYPRSKASKLAATDFVGIATLRYAGFSEAREFYSPKYEVATSSKPDIRRTLYWDPYLTLDSKGKGKLSFYTSDQKGTFIVKINGLSDEGVPLYAETTFEVE